jgi:hypothetical protein
MHNYYQRSAGIWGKELCKVFGIAKSNTWINSILHGIPSFQKHELSCFNFWKQKVKRKTPEEQSSNSFLHEQPQNYHTRCFGTIFQTQEHTLCCCI